MSLRLLVLLLLPSPAFAADALPTPATSLLQMLLGLGATLLVLLGALIMLKRLQGRRPGQGSLMHIRSAISVGTREKVVLLEVGKQVLVLGVTPGRINALHSLDASDLPPATTPGPLPGSEFAGRLRQMLERRHES
ncbi:flagellar biosynthetic protein FliO [Uliginosibacterium aquaticum]|uniref:Flagellar protein n=1 Tax=Uliginosibacterium aquaticum TaxID=2731212 RepID=A0ABX2IJ39_9RHOO|nr:flagellar biosynthetic protein FliO [Uliginosibacterium aquaticum]NSL56750.1 flagellar biosynthetic protein FliO [Uliginosibacterium aquaticum]